MSTTVTLTEEETNKINSSTILLKNEEDTRDIADNEEYDELGYQILRLEDCNYNADDMTILHMCTCGDIFEFKLDDLKKGNNRTECPSCSLKAVIQCTLKELDEFIATCSAD